MSDAGRVEQYLSGLEFTEYLHLVCFLYFNCNPIIGKTNKCPFLTVQVFTAESLTHYYTKRQLTCPYFPYLEALGCGKFWPSKKDFFLSGTAKALSEYRPDSVTHILQKVVLPSLGAYLTDGYWIHLAIYNYTASNKENNLVEKRTLLSQLTAHKVFNFNNSSHISLLSSLSSSTQFKVFFIALGHTAGTSQLMATEAKPGCPQPSSAWPFEAVWP